MNVFSDVTPGSVLALSIQWKSNRFLKGSRVEPLTGSSTGSELAPGSCWWKGGNCAPRKENILKSSLNSVLLVYSKLSLTNNLLSSYLHHVLAN